MPSNAYVSACICKAATSTFSHCLHQQAVRKAWDLAKVLAKGVSMGRACVRELMTSISCRVTTCTKGVAKAVKSAWGAPACAS